MRFAYLLPGLTERKVLSPGAAMGSAHLVQELVQTQAQCPEADDATRRSHLVVVTAHQLLEVSEQDFDGPTLSDVADDLLQGILQAAGGPVAAVFQVVVEVELDNEHLTGAQSTPRS